jgi:hypothetical protein
VPREGIVWRGIFVVTMRRQPSIHLQIWQPPSLSSPQLDLKEKVEGSGGVSSNLVPMGGR